LADTFVLGAEYEFPWMIGLELQDGRFFTENEAEAARAVAVIGGTSRTSCSPRGSRRARD